MGHERFEDAAIRVSQSRYQSDILLSPAARPCCEDSKPNSATNSSNFSKGTTKVPSDEEELYSFDISPNDTRERNLVLQHEDVQEFSPRLQEYSLKDVSSYVCPPSSPPLVADVHS